MTKEQIRKEAKKCLKNLTFNNADIAFQAGWALGVQSVLLYLAGLPSAAIRRELEEYRKSVNE